MNSCLPLQSPLKSSEENIASCYQIDISALLQWSAFKTNKRKCILKIAYHSRKALGSWVGLFTLFSFRYYIGSRLLDCYCCGGFLLRTVHIMPCSGPTQQVVQHHMGTHSLFPGGIGERIGEVQDGCHVCKQSKTRNSFAASHQQAEVKPLSGVQG